MKKTGNTEQDFVDDLPQTYMGRHLKSATSMINYWIELSNVLSKDKGIMLPKIQNKIVPYVNVEVEIKMKIQEYIVNYNGIHFTAYA